MLYDAFDEFLQVNTWYTRHPSDERRFFISLASVVKDPTFNPDTLGEYMREKKGLTRDAEDEGSRHFNFAIDDYVSRAQAVKDFLKYNRTGEAG